ncbi:hypothetical protein KKC60_03105 [Patescibacteria group bacterium]|nr:hypothetical protein [Patescibacteria group bacterium]
MNINLGKINLRNVMRKAGYKPWRDPRSGSESYIRRTGASFYPRFHAHGAYDASYNVILDLHFDWRRPMHRKGIKSTEGDESDTVTQEAERIKSFAR